MPQYLVRAKNRKTDKYMIVRFVVALLAILSASIVAVGGWYATDMFRVENVPPRDYSAFITFSITVNFALVVHRVRSWLFRSLKRICNARFIKAQGSGLKSLSENTGKTVCGYSDVLQYLLRRRLNMLAWIAIVGGPICAATGIFLLVADVPHNPTWFVQCLPCLLVPSCVYYVATLTCYLCMIDHYNQVCRGYVLYAKSFKESAEEVGGEGDSGRSIKEKQDDAIIKEFTTTIKKDVNMVDG